MSRPPLARERLLDAVEQELLEHGLNGVTLERVAERAGVSKGGLLYHFPSKASLFDGLFDRLADLVAGAVAAAPLDPEGAVRWYIDTSIRPSDQETSLYRALTALIRSSDDLGNDRLRRCFDDYAAPVGAAVADPVLVEQIRLVGDGLFLTRVLGVGRTDADVLERIVDELAARAAAVPAP